MKMNESIKFEIFYGKKTLFDHNHEILLLFTSKNFTCEVFCCPILTSPSVILQ